MKSKHIIGIMTAVCMLIAGFTSYAADSQTEYQTNTALAQGISAEDLTALAEPVQTAITENVNAAMEQRIAEEEARQKAEKEKKLLAAIIYCEAGGEPYRGQVAVGAVIMNRVKSSLFPNTIEGVIYQKGQFGPASSGKLKRVLSSGKATSSCYKAAEAALAGENPIGKALYFGNGTTGQKIGSHYFH